MLAAVLAISSVRLMMKVWRRIDSSYRYVRNAEFALIFKSLNPIAMSVARDLVRTE